MRPDMSKVIVERPRVGIKTTRKGRKVDPDLQLSQEGMRAPHIRNFNGKQLNENLAPLVRFINSRVGRNWDDVYSEICENIRSTSAVQHHVLEHVKTMVNICVTVNEDGSVISYGRYFQTIPYGWLFYVDSRTNILMRNHNYSTPSARNREYKNKREIERNSRERIMLDGTEVRKINGVWYEVEIQPVPAIKRVAYVDSYGDNCYREIGGIAYDVILQKSVTNVRHRLMPYATNYCKTKKQLNHNQLKKYNLEND